MFSSYHYLIRLCIICLVFQFTCTQDRSWHEEIRLYMDELVFSKPLLPVCWLYLTEFSWRPLECLPRRLEILGHNLPILNYCYNQLLVSLIPFFVVPNFDSDWTAQLCIPCPMHFEVLTCIITCVLRKQEVKNISSKL